MRPTERIAELEGALRRAELLIDQLQAQLNLRRRKGAARPTPKPEQERDQ